MAPPRKGNRGRRDRERVVLLKPTTFMNDSGRAVQEAANFFKLAAGVTVFQDELELPDGKVRVRSGRHRRPQRPAVDLLTYRQ
jgi:PTH1 family peptidyl-tRNA hydrolase